MSILTYDEFLNKTKNGAIFSITFVKREDGTIRKMLCRRSVKKHLAGGRLAFDPAKKNLLSVWDIANLGYRFINLDTMMQLKFGHKRYSFDHKTKSFIEDNVSVESKQKVLKST